MDGPAVHGTMGQWGGCWRVLAGKQWANSGRAGAVGEQLARQEGGRKRGKRGKGRDG